MIPQKTLPFEQIPRSMMTMSVCLRFDDEVYFRFVHMMIFARDSLFLFIFMNYYVDVQLT